MNPPSERVLLVTNDPETATAVVSALSSIGHATANGVCRNLRELVVQLERAPATGVLVDIDPDPTRILGELEPIVSRFADVRFVVLSSEQRNELVLEAMQSGARHFVLKESIAPELGRALKRVMARAAGKDAQRGAIITVLSASGGCGATMLAINLAHELHLASSEAVLLVDLDCCYGAVSTYLGLDGQYGLEHVLADVERIDAQLIRSTALAHPGGLHALISPASSRAAEPPAPNYEHLGVALNGCGEAYRYTVIDAPRVPMKVAASLVQASRLTLIVFQLNVKDIRAAKQMLTALGERGVALERMLPLANRYRKRHSMIPLSEAESALGRPVGRVKNDFRSAIRAVNLGKLLAEAAPRSALRRDVRQLTVKVFESAPEA